MSDHQAKILEMICGGAVGGTFGACVAVPLGSSIGTAIGEWLDPGSSSRPHAFEEPPAFLGMLCGWLLGIAAGAFLARFVVLHPETPDTKPPRKDIDDLS